MLQVSERRFPDAVFGFRYAERRWYRYLPIGARPATQEECAHYGLT